MDSGVLERIENMLRGRHVTQAEGEHLIGLIRSRMRATPTEAQTPNLTRLFGILPSALAEAEEVEASIVHALALGFTEREAGDAVRVAMESARSRPAGVNWSEFRAHLTRVRHSTKGDRL